MLPAGRRVQPLVASLDGSGRQVPARPNRPSGGLVHLPPLACTAQKHTRGSPTGLPSVKVSGCAIPPRSFPLTDHRPCRTAAGVGGSGIRWPATSNSFAETQPVMVAASGWTPPANLAKALRYSTTPGLLVTNHGMVIRPPTIPSRLGSLAYPSSLAADILE